MTLLVGATALVPRPRPALRHQSVIESPMKSTSMSPRFAISTKLLCARMKPPLSWGIIAEFARGGGGTTAAGGAFVVDDSTTRLAGAAGGAVCAGTECIDRTTTTANVPISLFIIIGTIRSEIRKNTPKRGWFFGFRISDFGF